jgi:hypothetical protein
MSEGEAVLRSNQREDWTAITYAQDFSDEGAGLGPQTILRLRRIVQAQRQGYNIGAVVLAGGLGPDNNEYPKQTRSFAKMMGDWLIREGTFPASRIYCSTNDRVWNCIEVSLEMIAMIKSKDLPRNVLVASTGFHIYPRMWVTWVLLCGGRKGWRLKFAPDWEGEYDALHELAGTVKYIPLALWHRWRI